VDPRTIGMGIGTHEERVKLNLHSDVHAQGTDPSNFLTQLAAAVKERVWERLVDERGDPLTFRRFIVAPYPTGIGSDVEMVRRLVALPHPKEQLPEHAAAMRELRADIERLLLEPLAAHGGARRRPAQDGNHTLPTDAVAPNSREYVLRRLRRDAPELAERVLNGALSLHAAAVEAGIRRRPTALDMARRAWQRLSPAERGILLAEVADRYSHGT